MATKTRRFDPVEAKERAQERMQQAMALLEEGIARILDSDSFAGYLRAMSRFHQYSAHNVALILAQNPEATRVAGYRAWQQLGRQVRKGEKGLVILVPLVSRVKGEGDAEADEQDERVVTRFGVGYVFDVAQTCKRRFASGQGAEVKVVHPTPMPTMPCPPRWGAPGYARRGPSDRRLAPGP